MSSFLPIFSHAEIQIKKLIAKYFWENKPETILLMTLNKYIDEFMRIYKASVKADIPNPLYYTFVRIKKFDK